MMTPNVGVFSAPPYIPSPGGLMECPTCHQHSPEAWKFLEVERKTLAGPRLEIVHELKAPQSHAKSVHVDWMHCANAKCGELIIRIHESYRTLAGGIPVEQHTKSWLARPLTTSRPIDEAVPDDLAAYYNEAAAVLDLSPRMSAVLLRRLLYDLLERYAQIAENTLKESIDAFVADTAQPRGIREKLHYLREMGNFAAHTQKDGNDRIIDVSKTDAEWCLDVIDRLFDHFIVGPEKDKALQQAWDQNLQDASRNPIPPLPEDVP